MISSEEETKYLTIKTKSIIQKLQDKYQDIVAICLENDPGNLRIGFQSWGPKHKIVLLLGGKNDEFSYWINNVNFTTTVPNNGSITSETLNKEFDGLCDMIDNLLVDYKKYKNK